MVARQKGGLFACGAACARQLLGSQRKVVVLHRDAHHENVFDFGERGWLAIDAKRVIGDHGYDYANLICNPELPTVTQPALRSPGLSDCRGDDAGPVRRKAPRL
ncbi:hypothetical protein E8F20_16330 [Pseudomonas sp. BN415]|nr:hypothetical protein [Pseudomonas sp. BN415]